MKRLKWIQTIRAGITFLLLMIATCWMLPTNCVFATENQNVEATQSCNGQKEVRFYVRLDGNQQYENGSTHYDASLYSPGQVGNLCELKQINAVADGNDYLHKITDDLQLEPSVESFDIGGKHYSAKDYKIVWYVIKDEIVYWHVDGILVKKAAPNTSSETVVPTTNKDMTQTPQTTQAAVTAMAQQSGTTVKTGDTQMVEVWLTLMCMAALVLAGMIWKRYLKIK